MTLLLVGLGAVVALPALRRGLNTAADVTSRGIRETSEAMSDLTGNFKSGWGTMVQDARGSCTNLKAGQVGAMTGAAIGGALGASTGGPLGASLGAVVGGGLGGAMGCHRVAQAPPVPDANDLDVPPS